jgi:hypothetical protein
MREFSPEERNIFSYYDPDKSSRSDGMVFADPFDIDNRWDAAIISQKTDINADFNSLYQVAEGQPDSYSESDPLVQSRMKALRNILPFIHDVFGTRPLAADGTGITFSEAYNNLNLWLNFREDVKKNIDDNPNSPISTQDLTEKSQAGKSSSDSILTRKESLQSAPSP